MELEYVNAENTPSARNIGAEHCTGDFIAFLDDDDEWYPGKLEMQLRAMSEDTSLVVSQYVHEGGICPARAPINGESILARNWVGCTSFPLIRLKSFQDAGGFDPYMRSNQEWELWMRLLDIGCAAFTEGILGIKHLSDNSITTERSKRRQGWFRLFMKHLRDYFGDSKSFCIALDYCFRDLFRLKAYCSS